MAQYGRRRRGRRSRKGYPRTIGRIARVSRRAVRRIKAAELANAETKKLDVGSGVQAVTIRAGDGTSAELRIFNPFSLIAQGVEKDHFIGNRIWIKGLRLRVQLQNPSATADFNAAVIRFTWFFSRSNASFTTAGSLYGNTTTSSTNPAQTSPLQNPVIYDDSTGGGFVPDGYASPFDTTNIKILKVKTIQLNRPGAATSTHCYKMWFPVMKNHEYLDPQETSLATPPNHGKYGSYYLTWQVFNGGAAADWIANTVLVNMSYSMTAYFKDL